MIKVLKLTICSVFSISQERIELWIYVFHADKHENLLQVGSIILDELGLNLQYHCDNLRKMSRMKLGT